MTPSWSTWGSRARGWPHKSAWTWPRTSFVQAYTPSSASKNLNIFPPPIQKTMKASMKDIFNSMTDKVQDSAVHHTKPLFSAKPTLLQQNNTPSMEMISSRFLKKDKDILQWSKKALKKYPQVSLYLFIGWLGKN